MEQGIWNTRNTVGMRIALCIQHLAFTLLLMKLLTGILCVLYVCVYVFIKSGKNLTN